MPAGQVPGQLLAGSEATEIDDLPDAGPAGGVREIQRTLTVELVEVGCRSPSSGPGSTQR